MVCRLCPQPGNRDMGRIRRSQIPRPRRGRGTCGIADLDILYEEGPRKDSANGLPYPGGYSIREDRSGQWPPCPSQSDGLRSGDLQEGDRTDSGFEPDGAKAGQVSFRRGTDGLTIREGSYTSLCFIGTKGDEQSFYEMASMKVDILNEEAIPWPEYFPH